MYRLYTLANFVYVKVGLIVYEHAKTIICSISYLR